jgi:hypothetical protein
MGIYGLQATKEDGADHSVESPQFPPQWKNNEPPSLHFLNEQPMPVFDASPLKFLEDQKQGNKLAQNWRVPILYHAEFAP